MRKRVISALALALVVSACGGGADDPEPVSTSANASNDTTSDDTVASDEPPSGEDAPTAPVLGLSRIPHDEAIFGGANDQVMNAVVAGGPGFVAVGWDDSIVPRAAAVWTSADGSTWSRVPHDEAVFAGGSLLIRDVVVGGPGFVAVGSAIRGFDRSAVVWTSPDGIVWSRVPHDEEVFGGDDWGWMNSVTAGGPGLVAVGGTGSEEKSAAVWTSVDGTTWSRVAHDEAAFGGDGIQEMLSVTSGGPGLVAVGREVDQVEFDTDAAVWTSTDGVTWTRAEDAGGALGGEDTQEMWDVTAGGPGLVAVGVDWDVDLPSDAAVWTSEDGVSWSQVRDEAVFGGQSVQRMWSVTVGGPGLIAVGISIVDDVYAHEAAVWTSVDGINWSRSPHDEGVFGGEDDQDMLGVTTGGGLIVIVGSSGPVSDSHAAAWVGS